MRLSKPEDSRELMSEQKPQGERVGNPAKHKSQGASKHESKPPAQPDGQGKGEGGKGKGKKP